VDRLLLGRQPCRVHLWSCSTGCALGTLRPCGARFTRVALLALHALGTLRSCCTCRPRWAGSAWSTRYTLIALDALLALWARRTLRTLHTLEPLGTGRALRREHSDMDLIVADDINDKIRYGNEVRKRSLKP
jgi:hypothetical protein